jgi:hypothetical protein
MCVIIQMLVIKNVIKLPETVAITVGESRDLDKLAGPIW